MNKSGFTLLEVLITLTVISSACFIVMPQIHHTLHNIQGRHYMDELVFNLYMASNTAVTRHAVINFTIDPSTKTYIIGQMGTRPLKVVPLPAGFTLYNTFTLSRFSFNSLGHISKSGTIQLVFPDGKVKKLTLYMAGGRFFAE
jgi:prepilin-type N-terminal cleavage/methylation domain-containing protein